MEFFDVVGKRKSAREYSDKSISKEDIEKIIDSARLAATARNEQPWQFVIIRDKEKIQKLGEIVSPNGAFLKGANTAIVVLSKDTKYYLEDCSAATENILLTAAALDIGACWIAGDKKEYADEVTSFVDAGGDERLASVIALGYPATEVASKPKKSVQEVIRWG